MLRIIPPLNILVASSCVVALSGCSRRADPAQWFLKNQEAAIALAAELKAHSSIKLVRHYNPGDFPQQYSNLNPADDAVFAKALSFCKKAQVLSIRIAREQGKASGDLISISFLLGSRGLAISGGSAELVTYIPDPTVAAELSDAEITIEPLNVNGWYAEYINNK